MIDRYQTTLLGHSDKWQFHFPENAYKNLLQHRDTSQYLIYFPLLKSREKLFEQEKIWKNICKELNWEFKPCI